MSTKPWLAAVLIFVSCTTGMGAPAPGAGEQTGGSGSGTGGSGNGGSGVPSGNPGTGGEGQPTTCAVTGAPPPTRVRRLTKVELLDATALLLDQSATASLANVDADSQINGGFSNSDQAVVSGSFANSLNLAADAIGAAFKVTVSKSSYDKGCFQTDAAAEACAKTFIQSFGAKAFRRALTADDASGLLAVYQAGREVGADGDAGDRFATGLSWIVRAVVQSPHLLYLTELGDPAVANGAKTTLTSEEIANALAFSVVGQPPDDALVAAAAQNQLADADLRAAQAARLIADHPDSWKKQMRQFVLQWLGINFGKPEWSKDVKALPLYTPALRDALDTETNMLVDAWATAPDGPRIGTLLTSPSTFVNATTAPLYGVSMTGSTFQMVRLDPAQRAGILTLGGFLGSTSHVAETSPVMRGKIVMQKFLCRDPPPPPPNVPPLPPVEPMAATTTRARFDAHLANPACSGCHALFQPIGDAFEEYDALGSYRTEENGVSVDSSGALVGATGGDQPVANAVDLMTLLAASPDTADCVARQTFRFVVGRLEGDFDACNVATARQRFTADRLDLRTLVSAIVASNSFITRTAAFQP